MSKEETRDHLWGKGFPPGHIPYAVDYNIISFVPLFILHSGNTAPFHVVIRSPMMLLSLSDVSWL